MSWSGLARDVAITAAAVVPPLLAVKPLVRRGLPTVPRAVQGLVRLAATLGVALVLVGLARATGTPLERGVGVGGPVVALVALLVARRVGAVGFPPSAWRPARGISASAAPSTVASAQPHRHET